MRTNRQISDIRGQVARIPKLGFIIAAFMLGLVILIVIHSGSKKIISPIEILLGNPQGPSRDAIVVSQDDITIYMPPNATDLDGTIFFAAAEPNLSLIADETEWILAKVVRVEFRRPDGALVPDISFSEPLDICFDFAEDQWQVFTENPDSYRIQYYADQKTPPRWEILPQFTYPDRFQLCGQTHKLSVFGLAIQADAGIPVTGLTTTLAPAAVLPPVQVRERRERDSSGNARAPQVIPTNPPPTSIPPTQPPAVTDSPPTELPATDPPLVQPPVIQPPVTVPPRVESPTNEEQRRAEEQAREEQRRAEEQAREEQKRAEEQAREEQRRVEEQAREEQRRAEEQAREEEKRAEEQAREEEKRAKEQAREE